MTAHISAPHNDEIEALRALAAKIWRQHYPAIIGTAQTEYMLAQRYSAEVIRAELAGSEIWWDVLREDGAMLAFASSFAQTKEIVKLDKLYVDPQRQRRGYGTMLAAHTCERAKRLGYGKVILAVNKRNAGAIAFYRKFGFEIVEAVVKDIGGGFVMDDYVMEKALASRSPRERGGGEGNECAE